MLNFKKICLDSVSDAKISSLTAALELEYMMATDGRFIKKLTKADVYDIIYRISVVRMREETSRVRFHGRVGVTTKDRTNSEFSYYYNTTLIHIF